jgi:hypothetical protein
MKEPGVEGDASLSELLSASHPGLHTLIGVVEQLDAFGIHWCIFGGLAIRFWGVRRAIADIDILLKADLAQCQELFPLAKPVAANGLQWDQVELWCEPMCLAIGAERVFIELDRDMQDRRVQARVAGKRIWVQSVEDIIVSKAILQRGGSKSDLQDLQSLLSAHAGSLDFGYVRQRARQAMAETRVIDCLERLNGAAP